VNAVKFNEYASVVVSAGYDQSLRAWDCRSHSTEPIQVLYVSEFVTINCEYVGAVVDLQNLVIFFSRSLTRFQIV
jgi:hypothetical protein